MHKISLPVNETKELSVFKKKIYHVIETNLYHVIETNRNKYEQWLQHAFQNQ